MDKNNDLKQKKIPWGRFIMALIITSTLFITVIYINEKYNTERVQRVNNVSEQIARDFLSTEIRFELLGSASCDFVSSSPILAEELGVVGSRVRTLESQVGINDPRVKNLRQYFDLLQIKDYLLLKNISERCGLDPAVLVYIESADCSDCEKQGYILEKFVSNWGDKVRVYWLEEDKNSSAINTLQELWKTTEEMSLTMISFGKKPLTINGFTSYEILENNILEYFGLTKDEPIVEEKTEEQLN